MPRIKKDLELMLGSKPNFYWTFSWKILTPICTLVIEITPYIIFCFNVTFNLVSYNNCNCFKYRSYPRRL